MFVFLSANYSCVIAVLIEFIMYEITIRGQKYFEIEPVEPAEPTEPKEITVFITTTFGQRDKIISYN